MYATETLRESAAARQEQRDYYECLLQAVLLQIYHLDNLASGLHRLVP